jgi:hypothetical protein
MGKRGEGQHGADDGGGGPGDGGGSAGGGADVPGGAAAAVDGDKPGLFVWATEVLAGAVASQVGGDRCNRGGSGAEQFSGKGFSGQGAAVCVFTKQ